MYNFCCTGSSLYSGFSSCGKWGLLSSCGVWSSRCGGFSCCVAQTLQCTGFSSFCMWAHSVVSAPRLQSTGSIVVVHGFSCSMAYGIFLDQGSNMYFPHWQTDSLALSHQGKPGFAPWWHFFLKCELLRLSRGIQDLLNEWMNHLE